MASPGDLDDERDALRSLERRLNAMFRERGVRVSISGWEEVQPEAGRPQALINPLVHECEIFIGLLNMRWGSATGTHTSGFEEEFEIALARRAGDDTPAIGMFFRAIDSGRLADKGPQLSAVLAFQERVRQERLALYKTFSSADQLALEIFDFLAPYAMRLADEIASAGEETGSTVAGSVPTTVEPTDVEATEAAEAQSSEDSGADTQELDSAQRQIVDALNVFAEMFTSDMPLDERARDRVTLVGTAFAKDQELLGTHHVNRLYSQRADLDLTLGEARAWYRTHFTNVSTTDREGRTVPIWGAIDIRDSRPRFIDELSNIAQDDDASVARGALRFMTAHTIRPEALWAADKYGGPPDALEAETPSFAKSLGRWSAIFEHFTGISVAINYLTTLATVDDVPLLTSIAASDEVDERSRLVLDALARTLNGDLDGCEHLAPTEYNSTDTGALRKLLIDVMPRLTAVQWDSMLNGTHKTVSAAAAVQLIEHEDVTDAQLKAAFELENPAVHDAMVERARRDVDWAVAKIQVLNELDKYSSASLVSRLLAASSPPEELDALDADEHVGVSCWVARTIQDPEAFEDAAREVLDGNSDFLNSRTAPLQDQYAAVAGYLTATAKAAACDVLANVANPDNRDLIRVADELRRDHYVSRGSALRTLVHMVTRLDNTPDQTLPDLGDLSVLDDYKATLEIENLLESPLAHLVVPIWRKSKIAALRTAAHSWELQQDDVADETLEEALYHDDDKVRMVAVEQLLGRWNNEQLEDLLTRYDQQDRAYWYNVIAALDEHLYGYTSGVQNNEQGARALEL